MGVKITELPSVVNALPNDIVPVVQGGVTKQVQFATAVAAAVEGETGLPYKDGGILLVDPNITSDGGGTLQAVQVTALVLEDTTGFTGTGNYTNFVIRKGIIENAS